MKSKLLKLTVAAFMVLTIKTQAQTAVPATLQPSIFFDGFETWAGTPTQPTVWMQAPASTMPATAVIQSVTTPTTLAAFQGTKACNLVNTATTYSYMATAPIYTVTAGMAYQISYYTRGKGTISSGISVSGTNTAPGGTPVSGKTWHHVLQSVTATASATNTAFFLKVKGTGVYTSGGTTITGIDVDSFSVKPYTPVAAANLYSLQQSDASGVSVFWGQNVGLTGGIVTRITNNGTKTGYFLQTTGSTSWGAMQVFDYTSGLLVNIGDSVTFGGFVDNYFGQTQMSAITNFANVSSGHFIAPMLLTTQNLSTTSLGRPYQSFLIYLTGVTVNSYTASYGQGAITDGSGVSATGDFKDGFYPPNGTATSGSAGNPGYVPTVTTATYCLVGNVYLNFGYNIMPSCSTDVSTGACTFMGIEKYNNNLNASTYPNPVYNQLTVKLPIVANKVSVSFTDVLGKEVMTLNNLSGSEIAINDISLPSGVYLVRITADGVSQLTKIIKQ
ncbi:MAG TPA: T9SS type A sorting domain-containing protein [Bacteroidia bacterium]